MRGRRILSRALLSVTLVAVGGIAVVAQASPAQAGSCTKQTGVSVSDPNTGWSWSSRWWCGNRGGAQMYGDANYYTHTAYMDSTWSWVVCYRYGAHSGGSNNVWYYTKGDRSAPGMSGRQAWGYLPAGDVWTSTDPWPGIPACPVSTSPPGRGDSFNEPILFVHGYELDFMGSGGFDCNAWYWPETLSEYQYGSWPTTTRSKLRTIGFYNNDRNCDTYFSQRADHEVPIQELGRRLAWRIWDDYSRFGVSVDVVAHSMGGLILRAALTGNQQNLSGWPPYIYVEDAVSELSPHGGTEVAFVCVTRQCRDMWPNSAFLVWCDDNPQGDGGTDWTLFGADDDDVVPAPKAINMVAGHKVVYHTGGTYQVEHMDFLWQNSGWYRYKYWDYQRGPDVPANWVESSGSSYPPLIWAKYAGYYWSTW